MKNKVGSHSAVSYEAETSISSGVKKILSSVKTSEELVRSYPMGTRLVEFLLERNMIRFESEDSTVDVEVEHGVLKSKPKVVKKEKYYFREKTLYAVCTFDIGMLPINFNLPMVCMPEPWRSTHSR